MTTATYGGLFVEGTTRYDPGDYWTPPEGEVEVYDVGLDDAQDFYDWEHRLLDRYSPGVQSLIYRYHRAYGRLAPGLADLFMREEYSSLEDALASA